MPLRVHPASLIDQNSPIKFWLYSFAAERLVHDDRRELKTRFAGAAIVCFETRCIVNGTM